MKKIFLASLLIITCSIHCYSQQNNDDPVIKIEPSHKKAVHKSLIKPVGWTNDFEKIYSATEIKKLDSLIALFEKRTTIEIAIVTVTGTQTTADGFDDFANKLAIDWGVGKKETNNGVVIAISQQYHKMRICTGTGTERVLSDAEAKEIIDDYFIPEFKKGNYFIGTWNGLNYLMKVLKGKHK